MSSLLWLVAINLMFCWVVHGQRSCPMNFSIIGSGCYKVYNGSNMTWDAARETCLNALSSQPSLNTTFVTHLVAIEDKHEKIYLAHWLNAYDIERNFWIDGVLETRAWNWSNTPISWFYNDTELKVTGNGSNFKFAHDSSVDLYRLADDDRNRQLNYICELQPRCNGSNPCQNGADCYLNIGVPICVCPPGYSGANCEIDLDECLATPCEHGGICSDLPNNYTCNCSLTTYTGNNCEIALPDPKAKERTIALWCVVGVVCALIVILTISDLPLTDMCMAIGCAPRWCSEEINDEKPKAKPVDLTQFRPNISHSGVQQLPIVEEPAPAVPNYQVVCKVWNPEKKHYESATNSPLHGYGSAPQHSSFKQISLQVLSSKVMKSTSKPPQSNEKSTPVSTIKHPSGSTMKGKAAVANTVKPQLITPKETQNTGHRENSGGSTKQLIPASESTA